MSDPYLSIVIPAYNEEKRIGKTLEVIGRYLATVPFSAEILVVLDGVRDNTLGVVQAFAEGRDDVRWIDRKENRGKGYTVREGMLAAKGQIRLFADADNSTDIAHFDKMKPKFDAGSHVVIATRDSKDVAGARQEVPQSFFKRLLGNAGNLFIQAMAVPGIWDTQCGFKAFSAESADKIFAVATMDRWVFDIEALALARKFGYTIDLIPAYWINDDGSKVSFANYLGSLGDTVKVRVNLMTGKYDIGERRKEKG